MSSRRSTRAHSSGYGWDAQASGKEKKQEQSLRPHSQNSQVPPQKLGETGSKKGDLAVRSSAELLLCCWANQLSRSTSGQPVVSCQELRNARSRRLDVQVCLEHYILQNASFPAFLWFQVNAASNQPGTGIRSLNCEPVDVKEWQ